MIFGKNGAMFATFNILTPLPGTELFRSMIQENRIIDTDWSHYDMDMRFLCLN